VTLVLGRIENIGHDTVIYTALDWKDLPSRDGILAFVPPKDTAIADEETTIASSSR
jgi:hypothetical protein